MIRNITGQLLEVQPPIITLALGPLTLEILTPVGDEPHWRNHLNQTVNLHSFTYLESQGQGNLFLPRLIGFINETDREFFLAFTKVKGIGYRKALRAMAMPVASFAEAIAARDVAMLKTLPEIGKKTAETIIAELHDKVEPFIISFNTTSPARAATNLEGKPITPRLAVARDALAVLVQLGENRLTASKWIDRVLADNENIETVEQIVNAAFQYREG